MTYPASHPAQFLFLSICEAFPLPDEKIDGSTKIPGGSFKEESEPVGGGNAAEIENGIKLSLASIYIIGV